ncbi:MAG TPA: hypothetical protein VFZ64_07340 [Nocardioidaceae bacterium]
MIESIEERGPGLVALSGHDSTPWTITAFEQVFGDPFRPLLGVGEPLTVTAA